MGDLLQRLGELMDQGGFVMWPLLFMSIFTIALSFERLVFWLRVNSSARLRFGKFMSALHVGSTARVRDIAAKDDSPYGELADRLAQGEGDADSISVEVVEYQRPRIERYMLVFSTIVTAAPMLGILGTVLGIIRSFE
ncbi:MAG: MotA/TolQ/ExbB proton channel family protein, partial [Planctomycetota bacterium]|nr:MotA/TolQ/ExbB proton channel family protein [Planctomycetota bacterium]